MSASPPNLSPPRIAQWLLLQVTKYDYHYAVLGDFEEIYNTIASERGFLKALQWYWLQVFKSLPGFISDLIYWSIIMLVNYLKSAYRNLSKEKVFSAVNIFGLTIGMAACLLILHYVSFERSYDSFHPDSERIYRLRYERTSEDGTAARFASCTPPAGKLIRERYTEVEQLGRMLRYSAAVSYEDTRFIEERMFFAEPQLFEVLRFHFIEGELASGISSPNKAFLSESTARKYFGDENPIGKVFSVDKKVDYQVTGLFKDLPPNSHVKIDILLAYENLVSLYGEDFQHAWGHTGMFTYLRTKPGVDPNTFEKKLQQLVEAEFGEGLRYYNITIDLKMQPLRDIHLTSHYMQEFEVNGDRNTVTFLMIIAVFIIIMAWVNYINLSTARSLTRAKEVGLRKVVGATRKQLMVQFFFETILINLFAMIIALGLIGLLTPTFNNFTGMPLQHLLWKQEWLPAAIALMFAVGVVFSGLYPIMVLTSFDPIMVLKGKLGGNRGINLRKALVVFQFVIALGLISATITVSKQLSFMQNHDLGLDIDQTLVVKAPRVRDNLYGEKFDAFKVAALQHHSIEKISHVTEVPGRQIYWDAGGIRKEGEDAGSSKNYQIVGVDDAFINAFDLKLVAGRSFSKQHPSDKAALILNETAVKWMGFENAESAIGERVNYWGEIFTIVGVLRDYHQQSLKAPFEPHIYRYMPTGRDIRGQFAIKLRGKDLKPAVEMVKKQYDRFFPGNPYEYFFLDEYYNQQYQADRLFGEVFALFSALAIIITSLGIFGLSSFSAAQRTREISIRKVLGASVSRILLLLTRDFLIMLAISFFIAAPLLFLGLNYWLDGYANRMELNSSLFMIPLVTVGGITLLTVSYQTIKSATINPVDALKYE